MVTERGARMEGVAGGVAETIDAERGLVEEATSLAKADLATGKESEFASLQSVAGGMLANRAGANGQVAEAIAQQYRSARPGGLTPAQLVAAALAIAGRYELLYGMFAAGICPTGSRATYALRRTALGLMRILLETETKMSLGEMSA